MSSTNSLAVKLVEMMLKAGLSEERILELFSASDKHIEHIDYSHIKLPTES